MCAPIVRITGDDAPYGDHFVVWGTAAPSDAEEDRAYDVMSRIRAWDRTHANETGKFEPELEPDE